MKKRNIIAFAVLSAIMLTAFGCSGETDDSNVQPVTENITTENTTESSTESSTEAAENTPAPQEVIQPFIDYFDGFNEGNPEKIIAAVTPQCYIDAMKNVERYEEFVNATDMDITMTMEQWTTLYGADPKASYIDEISNTKLNEEQIKLAELCYKYTYYDLNTDVNLTDGYEVNFKYCVEGADSREEAEETACFVCADDEKWHMIALSAEMLKQYEGAEDPFAEVE